MNILGKYSTNELHEELIKREGVTEIIIYNESRGILQIKDDSNSEQLAEPINIIGPVSILINRD